MGDQNKTLGRSRGGLTTKIHVAADTLGRPVKIILTGGEQNDCTQAESLLQGRTARYILADKGYDTDATLSAIKKNRAEAVLFLTRKIEQYKGILITLFIKTVIESKECFPN